jgi:outer membrane cobalamin receptor
MLSRGMTAGWNARASAVLCLSLCLQGALESAQDSPSTKSQDTPTPSPTPTPGWSQEISVTANRGPQALGDTASRVAILDNARLRAAAAVTLDDALRQIPGFTLFRRTGSRVANPTAQGASLRGIGPSGASRTLVLIDGFPLNDAFGGWVFWGRVPRVALERIELMEGGASDLYGSGALAGVIQGLVRQDSGVSLELAMGSRREQQASLYAAGRRADWGVRFAGEAFRTKGYRVVEAGRGAADTPANSRHLTGAIRLERGFDRGSFFVEGARFGESRDNGTPLQVNDTDWQQLSAGANARDRFSIRAFFGAQTYHQAFSAVAADRNTESLTRRQRVPSRDAGLLVQWTMVTKRNALSLGADGRLVRGRSEETAIAAGRATTFTDAGGHQASLGIFATDRFSVGRRGVLTVGARADRWSLASASSIVTPLATGITSTTSFRDRATTTLSPRASVLLRLGQGFRLTAAGYGAFRAPTLNELYRSFRVGDTQTLANENLTAERLRGVEGGALWERGGVHARVVAFRAEVRDGVANVTQSSTAQLITRKRQNLGRTRSQGLTSEFAFSTRRLRLGAGYSLTDASVIDFPALRLLEGKAVAQVPRHQWTAQARVEARGFEASAQARFGGRQFEDDLNSLTLKSYFVADARLSRRLGDGVEAFVSIENLADSRYPTGLTPIATVGPPRILRVGLRLDRRPGHSAADGR